MYEDTSLEGLQMKAKKRNDEALDKLCKNICLIIGWVGVFCLFIYTIYLIIST